MVAPIKFPIILTQPLNISFDKWANSLYIDLRLKTVIIPPDEKDWVPWAQKLVSINYLDGVAPIPSKSANPQKGDWRKWASQFVSSMNDYQNIQS